VIDNTEKICDKQLSKTKGHIMKSTYDLESEIEEYQEKINLEVENFFNGIKPVSAERVGLDRRCGNVYVGSDFIAVKNYDKRNIEYYGGFEYINRDHVKTIGEYVIYNPEFEGEHDDRIQDCIDCYKETDEDHD
jgi:hypothetical protein